MFIIKAGEEHCPYNFGCVEIVFSVWTDCGDDFDMTAY